MNANDVNGAPSAVERAADEAVAPAGSAGGWRRFRGRLAEARWTIATVFVVYLAHLARYLSWVPRDYHHGGDGFYVYMLARSIAFDGDLDLTNDYRVCGDPWLLGHDYGTGLPGNPYYIGASTVWSPALFVLRRLVSIPTDAPDSVRLGCTGIIPYTLGLLLAPLFAALTTYLGYRIARRFVAEGPALVAVLMVGIGSGLNTFGPLWWNYSHVWAAAVVTAMGLAVLRVVEKPEATLRWLVLGALVGWSYLMRPHHAVWIVVPFLMTLDAMWHAVRARRVPYREALRGLVGLAACLAVGSVRAWSYHVIYGEYFPNLAGNVYVQPLHAHPFLVLFAGRAGLVYQSPLTWFALVGIALAFVHAGASRWARFVFVGLAIDFWVCSSALDWAGGATVGPRLLVSFTGLFVPYSAIALERLWRWVNVSADRLRRFAVVGWLVPALAFSWQLIYGDPPYRMPSVYGGAFARNLENLDVLVGNPVTLPATAVFALRYRTHPRNFDVVAVPGDFYHAYDTGLVAGGGTDRLLFAHPPADVLFLEGAPTPDHGLRLAPRRRARFLQPLNWPTVTAVELQVVSETRCSLVMEAGQFTYRTHLGRRRLAAGVSTVRFRAPPGAFDSGINEVILRSSCAVDVRSLRWIDETEHDVRTATMRRKGAYLIR